MADGRKWTLRSNLHYQTDSADLTDSKFQKNKIVLVALRSNALHVEWMYFTCVKKKTIGESFKILMSGIGT